jgi:hypothetical protein
MKPARVDPKSARAGFPLTKGYLPMSHYLTSYKGLDRSAADTQAIEDIKEYVGAANWKLFLDLADHPETTVDLVNATMGFAGISGYPFHAFCRAYMLTKYRAWMAATNDAGSAVMTDAAGFALDIPA